jgi:uncharacterized protein
LILFLLSLIPAYIYLCLRLASEWYEWLYIFAIFLPIMSFPFRKVIKHQTHLTYAAMAILTYIFLFTIIRDLFFIFSGFLWPVKYVTLPSFVCIVTGFLNAIIGLRIKKVLIPVKNLPADLSGLTICQISDLHVGPTIKKKYIHKVVNKVNALSVDIIALTGDIGDGPVSIHKEDASILRYLKSKHGIFYVTGNHEYYWNVKDWLKIMSDNGFSNLVNRSESIVVGDATVNITGVPDPIGGVNPVFPDFDLTKTEEYRILLSHRPGIWELASKKGFDLQLSGHTHGGQFFPWTLVVKFVHKLSKGLHRVDKMWVYVNPGTGSWGPLVRLGTTPEITILTLTQSK